MTDNGLPLPNIISKMETMTAQPFKVRDLEDLQAFLQVADSGGFSTAARLLDLPVSVVSKRIARLEAALGTRLFQRSTRAVQLTDEGKTLIPQAQRLCGDLKELEDQFSDAAEMKGVVRLTLPWNLSQGPIARLLTAFHRQHPQVQVQLHFSDHIEKLVDGGFDLAVRFSHLADSTLIARRLGANYLKIVASPAYLRQHGTPHTVAELLEHPLLILPTHRPRKFRRCGLSLEAASRRSPMVSNGGTFLLELAKAGFGIAIRSHWDVAEALFRQDLVEVHIDDELEPGHDAYLVTPSSRHMSRRVRALMDTLVEELPKFLQGQPQPAS
jgi:DNA-binding transcriptional LysR family regulator